MTDPYVTPEPSHSVLITIDTQNDFTLVDAPARIAGTSDVIPAMKATLEVFRKAQRPIIHVIRLYNSDGSNADVCRRSLVESGTIFACPNTDGAELVEELKPDPAIRIQADKLLGGELQKIGTNEWLLYKPRWSAFYQTQLEAVLQNMDINTVVIAGCNYPNCPRATIYDASNRDFRVVVVTDAMSGLYERGIEELRGIAVATLPSQEMAPWLNQE